MELTEPPPIIEAEVAPLESEVILLAGCNGHNVELARDTLALRTTARLARLRILAPDSAAQIDSDLASGRVLLEGAAQSVFVQSVLVGDLTAALAVRAGLLRSAAADSAELASATERLASQDALNLSGEELAYFNTRVALLPARIADSQAGADAALPGIRDLIAQGGIDLVALVADLYASTNLRGTCATYGAFERGLRSDIEDGFYAIPPG